MLHEDPQAHVVREDALACRAVVRVVCEARVELGNHEARLGLVLVAHDVARHREALVHDPLGVGLRGDEEVFKVDVLLVILVALVAPHGDLLSVEHDHVKERVQQQDRVRAHARGVEQHGRRRALERVGQERRLDHDERVRRVLAHQHAAVVGGLVGRGVEELKELRTPQVEHKLRVHGELLREPERARIILPVVCELGAQPDERPVYPSQNVGHLLRLGAVRRDARHEHCRGLLVEAPGDGRGIVRVAVPRPTQRRGAQPRAAIRMLVLRHELDVPPLVRRQRVRVAVGDLEVNGERGRRVDAAHAPGRRTACADLSFGDVGAHLLERGARPDRARDFELARCRHVDLGGEAHLQVAAVARRVVRKAAEHAAQGLLEDGLAERVGQHDEPARLFAAGLHLEQADLVERASEDVNHVTRRHGALRQRLVELLRRLHVRRVVLLDVGVRADGLGLGPADDHARARRRRPADEGHDSSALPRVGRLEQADGHAERHAAAPLGALVRRHRPRVALQVLEDRLQREATLGDRQEEAAHRRLPRARLRLLLCLLRLHAPAAGGQDAEQVLHLLCRVLLRAAEDVRLRALSEPELVHHDVSAKRDEADERVLRDEVERLLQRVLQLIHLLLV
mmetsp:Transcript_36851/g.85109  ORF Transcript_36851/g.85109 Transcript_36851/m.85109 type:complete len:626 (+) Transcript_36851:273-2150(+)